MLYLLIQNSATDRCYLLVCPKMFSRCLITVLFGAHFVSGQDIEMALAEKNMKGYPSALLLHSVSSGRNEVAMDRSKVAELLESSEVRTEVTKAALEYSAQELNESGQARYLLSDPGMCEYSWITWLPWMDCGSPETKQASTSLPLIMETSYSCYQ